ncbi:AbrB family transcriptional regulator [Lutimaribacter marinistellae]|uniref:AbrB family transcriptional regulator n=1 Tax=Lutimaribacter marinistellae TaxID=1820329 RepID=A0ABV7TIV2_9RHOB
MDDPIRKFLTLFGLLAAGLAGALLARAMGAPLPFLLGSLVVTASVSLTVHAQTGRKLWFPELLRRGFVAIIGLMIGSSFSPELIDLLPGLWPSMLALVVFIVLAELVGYAVFRGIGRYDPVTAAYSAMPGGLIEAAILGERAGGDVATVSLQHFIRIVLVVALVPMIFLVVTGDAVGSAAGEAMTEGAARWQDWLLYAALAPVGLLLGQWLRVPAGQLVGPLLLSAVLNGTGLLALAGPASLLNLAQLVVGCGLGVRFARSTLRQLLTGAGLGFVAVSLTLCISALFAWALAQGSAMPFSALLISFAPGGVTEMSLIALSLGVSPLLVTVHHLFRIVLTVTLAGMAANRAQSWLTRR